MFSGKFDRKRGGFRQSWGEMLRKLENVMCGTVTKVP